MCSTKVVKVAALIISHQIFKPYEKLQGHSKRKRVPWSPKNHKGRLYNKILPMCPGCVLPSSSGMFLFLHSEQEKKNVCARRVLGCLFARLRKYRWCVCGKMFVRRSKCSNSGRLRLVYAQADPVSKRENRNRDEVHGNSFKSCLQC